jgi:hypothetical protein
LSAAAILKATTVDETEALLVIAQDYLTAATTAKATTLEKVWTAEVAAINVSLKKQKDAAAAGSKKTTAATKPSLKSL